MKKIFLITAIISFGLLSSGQDNKFSKEINEQVWLPFVKGFSNGDDELFKSVHSKEVVRVTQDDKQIIGYDKYFQKIPDSIKAKWGNWKKNIELRFTQRIASEDKAFEVGYYRSTSTNTQTGEQRTGIGKFHVLLRKENGVWKILVDADSGKEASEEEFKKAAVME